MPVTSRNLVVHKFSGAGKKVPNNLRYDPVTKRIVNINCICIIPSAPPPTAPSPPIFGIITPSSTELTFNWSAPNDGGRPIQSYTITCNGETQTVSSGVLTATFTGLTPSTSYTVTLYATNIVGNSTPITETIVNTSAPPPTAPSPPIFGIITPSSTELTFNWSAPNDGGRPIQSYTITLGNQQPQVLDDTITSYTFTGLTPSTSYTVTLYAINIVGNSTPITETTVSTSPPPPTAPSPPIFGIITPSSTELTFNWSAPNDGGRPIQTYTIMCNGETQTVSSGVLTATFTGLTPSTSYTVTLYATNIVGNSTPITETTVSTSPPDPSGQFTFRSSSPSVIIQFAVSAGTQTATITNGTVNGNNMFVVGTTITPISIVITTTSNDVIITGLTNLTTLDCYNNQLTSLDVSQLTNLTTLNCYSNQISSLNVTNLTLLTSLTCFSNLLTTLDVTNLTLLTSLNCGNNPLTSLDVSTLTLLTSLTCYTNQLTTLDVTNLTNLTFLNCNNNSISVLDVTNLTNLTTLDCSNNQLNVTTANDILNALRTIPPGPPGNCIIVAQQGGNLVGLVDISSKNWAVQ